MAQGGVKGFGKNAPHLLMLLEPFARVGGTATRFLMPLVRSGNLRVAVEVAVEGPCTFQAVDKAVSISGFRYSHIGFGPAPAQSSRFSIATSTAGTASLRSWGEL